MMLSKFVRGQLVIFAILTVIGLVLMATVYVKLPAMFGIGRYDVTLKLPATGGLYPHANVSYRGTNVGEVQEVRLTPDGVDAKLSIDSDAKIPTDVSAVVRSVSAIGEQYVDFTPKSAAGGQLSNGDVITVGKEALPQDVGPLLDQLDRTLATVEDTRLQQLIDDAFTAFNGTGPDLQRFIDSASLLIQTAEENAPQTKQLIEQLGPLLDTQVRSKAAIESWTRDLATVTDQLRASDPQLRDILAKGPGAADEANRLFQDLRPTLPLLLANLVSVGQVTSIYHAGLEQVLVIYPAIVSALRTAVRGPVEYGAMVDFMVETNDPPACFTGFLPPEQRRGGGEVSVPPTPGDLYCKVAPDAPEVVRGARNTPCMEFPGKRAPSPDLCRDPQGYVPLGNNPQVGPPQPVAPAAVAPAKAQYDPGTGTYFGPDGKTYTQPDVDGTVPADWKALMIEQQGK